MREPAFWWQPGTGGLLTPFSALYGAVAAVRMQSAGQRAGLPVICLGNLTIGGAGKTPAALAVAQLLHAAHERPFFLSRGYGGRLAGPVRVNPAIHHAADVGDEPLLLTRLAPTIVSRDRVAGAKHAQFAGAADGEITEANDRQAGVASRQLHAHSRHRGIDGRERGQEGSGAGLPPERRLASHGMIPQGIIKTPVARGEAASDRGRAP